MEIQRQNGTLNVSGVRELSAVNARQFRNEICARLAPELKSIEIDLSQTNLVDSCGLGALVSLHKAANELSNHGSVAVRLVNPQAPVQQVFELTRMHHLFEIVLPNSRPTNGFHHG
ncbi:MAG TPA: STAS domain-containing protein [Candidatus Acidoferrum sp.]|jgi:anti-sigma B factor antagonist|nr:STAS domain-containing protein [Candidatus Acidoferrum sp.]